MVPGGVEDQEKPFELDLGARRVSANPHQRRIDGDAVQPGSQTGALTETTDSAKCAQESLLHRVTGVVLVAQETASHREHPASVAEHQLFVACLVAGFEPLDQARLVALAGA